MADVNITSILPLNPATTSDRRLLELASPGVLVGTRVLLDGDAADPAQQRLAVQYTSALVTVVPGALKAAM